jgi:hypothetical protein
VTALSNHATGRCADAAMTHARRGGRVAKVADDPDGRISRLRCGGDAAEATPASVNDADV